MSKKNENLNKAAINKNDEFYTLYETIENEIKYYKDYFEDKIVYCNCDNEKSNFYKFFKNNFDSYKLKQLICTSYNREGHGKIITISRNEYGISEIIKDLNGNGSFDSEECVEILHNVDIVVTNPPFSIFLQYYELLKGIDGLKFIILGTLLKVVTKSCFSGMINGEIFLGKTLYSGDIKFYCPDEYENKDVTTYKNENGVFSRIKSVRWIQNIKFIEPESKIMPSCLYYGNEEHYPKYDKYNAINVNKIKEIPSDYYGCMGVPITYFDRRNDDIFEIIELVKPKINGKELFDRIIIKRK